MPSCAVKWCGKNTSTSNFTKDGITFHRFPRDPTMRAVWLKATRRENLSINKHSVLCSRHFTSDCFENLKNQRRRLLYNVVPTLFLPVLSNTPNEEHLQNLNKVSETVSSTSRCNKKKQTKENKQFGCDSCQAQINGYRHVCVQCLDDLCVSCRDGDGHSAHYVMRIPEGKSQEEIYTILKIIRRIIQESNNKTNDPEHVNVASDSLSNANHIQIDEPVVKVEYDSEVGADPIGVAIKEEPDEDAIEINEEPILQYCEVPSIENHNETLVFRRCTPRHTLIHVVHSECTDSEIRNDSNKISKKPVKRKRAEKIGASREHQKMCLGKSYDDSQVDAVTSFEKGTKTTREKEETAPLLLQLLVKEPEDITFDSNYEDKSS